MLDKPVNGLDPQQIVFVREALLRLASEGTTILLSSHLLWEVEQTCSKVVVVDHGRLVKSGTVAEVTGSATSAYIEADDPSLAFGTLRHVPGIASVAHAPPGIAVQLGTASRCDLVAALVAAGMAVRNRHASPQPRVGVPRDGGADGGRPGLAGGPARHAGAGGAGARRAGGAGGLARAGGAGGAGALHA